MGCRRSNPDTRCRSCIIRVFSLYCGSFRKLMRMRMGNTSIRLISLRIAMFRSIRYSLLMEFRGKILLSLRGQSISKRASTTKESSMGSSGCSSKPPPQNTPNRWSHACAPNAASNSPTLCSQAHQKQPSSPANKSAKSTP